MANSTSLISRTDRSLKALLYASGFLLFNFCSDRSTTRDADAGDDGNECMNESRQCIPYERKCGEDGTVLQCRDDGSEWEPAPIQCGEAQHCDSETAECLCSSGSIPVLEDGSCKRVGPECAEGFMNDDEGGCAPKLGACTEKEVALIGGSCVRVGENSDCGEGTWGNIPTDDKTVYVDLSYTGGDSTGDRVKPFTKIQEGLDAVEQGGTVAVAEGRYNEALIFKRASSMNGRCAEMVTVTATGIPGANKSIIAEAVGSVSIEGINVEGYGIKFVSVENAIVRQCRINDVEGCGFWLNDTSGTIERNTVSLVKSFEGGIAHGLQAVNGSGKLTVYRNAFININSFGIGALNIDVEVVENKIEDTGDAGITIVSGVDSNAIISGNAVKRGHGYGIYTTGGIDGVHIATLRIEANDVSEIEMRSDYQVGEGIRIEGPLAIDRANLSRNIVSSVADTGIMVVDVDAALSVEANMVQESGADPESSERLNGAPAAIDVRYAVDGGVCTITGNTIRTARGVGISAFKCNASILFNAVFDTQEKTVYFEGEPYPVALGIRNKEIHGPDGPGGIIDSNIVRGGNDGIQVAQSPGAAIENNMVSKTGCAMQKYYGVAISSPQSQGSRTKRNILLETCGVGIRTTSSGALIEGNYIVRMQMIRMDWVQAFWISSGIVVASDSTAAPPQEADAEILNNIIIGSGAANVPATDELFDSQAIDIVGAVAHIEGNRIARQPVAGVLVVPLLKEVGGSSCQYGSDVTIENNILTSIGGIGVLVQGVPGGTGCSIVGKLQHNVISGVSMVGLKSIERGEYVQIADCVAVIDGPYFDVIENHCTYAERLGVFFSGAAGGNVISNSITETAVAGSIDECAEGAVTCTDNTLLCNGLDNFQKDGGWPKPPRPSVPDLQL